MSGSKFFRGQAQSEAVFVPPQIMDKLIKANDGEEINKLGASYFPPKINSYFGKSEIPKELTRWRHVIEDNQNPGLALRWTSALANIKAWDSLSKEDVRKAKVYWRS